MKAVLMAFDPIDCNLIFNGEKIIDVRKVAPNLDPPYTVYMYMVAAKERFPLWEYITAYTNSKGEIVNGSQKVVGEFVCCTVEKYDIDLGGNYYRISDKDCIQARLDQKLLFEYGNGRDLHGLHITSPKRYDTPKELYEFTKACDFRSNCGVCTRKKYLIEDGKAQFMGCDKRIYRAPQSWMYVEEVEE